MDKENLELKPGTFKDRDAYYQWPTKKIIEQQGTARLMEEHANLICQHGMLSLLIKDS